MDRVSASGAEGCRFDPCLGRLERQSEPPTRVVGVARTARGPERAWRDRRAAANRCLYSRALAGGVLTGATDPTVMREHRPQSFAV